MVSCRSLASSLQLSVATPDLQLLLQPAGFRGIKRRGQRLAVVDASQVADPLIDLIDHRLKV